MIKNRWSFSGISSLIHFTFFSFSQEAINATRIFLEDLKKLPPGGNDINILVATHELESFSVKYGNTHLTANESAVTVHVQKLLGEFYALFEVRSFFHFSVYIQLHIQGHINFWPIPRARLRRKLELTSPFK